MTVIQGWHEIREKWDGVVKRIAAIGIQDFGDLIRKQCFYVDKTDFIREWWENQDSVTLITRPRRFGKTLAMSMLDYFFSIGHAGEGELFEKLHIWQKKEYQGLQGTYPVISLSFAGVKEQNYQDSVYQICQILTELYQKHYFLMDSDRLLEEEKLYFRRMAQGVEKKDASRALYQLSRYLMQHYGKKVLIFLDEYDTPMQEAYVGGFWKELAGFTRSLFNSTFKTNPYLERAIMTGITRVSKESLFSDLNNLEIVTTTSDKYADMFGFTEKEVFSSMDEFGFTNKDEVKQWYDGFRFGEVDDIYNPWSVVNFLDKGKLAAYWSNTSSNSLAEKLIREGDDEVKKQFEQLLRGEAVSCYIDEEVAYNQLDGNANAVWSLLLASGYLKVQKAGNESEGTPHILALTNLEVRKTFEKMIRGWFGNLSAYNEFVKALLIGDIDAMNEYMNMVAQRCFSSFDTGRHPSERVPERFYHGFVLGLLVELSDRYAVESNRESGYGRYDVLITPHEKEKEAFILEFKVWNPRKEKTLEDSVSSALLQIEERQYEQTLFAHGIRKENIRKYGFAFRGAEVLIGGK